jgi:hypothetical protein
MVTQEGGPPSTSKTSGDAVVETNGRFRSRGRNVSWLRLRGCETRGSRAPRTSAAPAGRAVRGGRATRIPPRAPGLERRPESEWWPEVR